MTSWRDYHLPLGLPHLMGMQLSEVELMKMLGMYQWDSISQIYGRPVNKIENAQAERLYASFISVELGFPGRTTAEFDEGDVIHVKNKLGLYGRRFVEGLTVFDREPISDEQVEHIDSREALAAAGLPWAYMTNAFVAREGSNNRLKVTEPASPTAPTARTLTQVPVGIREHRDVSASGDVPRLDVPSGVALPVRSSEPIRYAISPEVDLNAAGLLYFARYPGIASYVERRHVAERLERPISSPLFAALCLERRRLFYFANAEPTDAVDGFVTVELLPRTAAAPGRPAHLVELVSRVDLYRASDHALMASSLTKRVLVEGVDRALASEAERLHRRAASR